MCSPGKFAHFPVEDFDREKLFLIGPGLSTDTTKLTHTTHRTKMNRRKKRHDESKYGRPPHPVVGDIMFTKLQAQYLATQGINVSAESVDGDYITKRYQKNGYTTDNVKGAALFTNLWTDNYDANTETYSVPYFFHNNFPNDGRRAAIRTGLQEMEKVTCIRFTEIEQSQISQWSHSIAIHYTVGGQGCRSYVGQVK